MRQNENRINFHSLQTTTIFGPRYIDIEIEFKKKKTHLISQRWSKPVVKTTKIWCWPRFLMCTHLCHEPWHRSEIINDPSVGQATCSKTGRGHGCNSPVLITPCFVNTLGKNAPPPNIFPVPGQAYTCKWMGIGLDQMPFKNNSTS